MTPAARLYAESRAYEAMFHENIRAALGIEYENRGTTYMRILAITRRYRRRERY